MAGHYAERLKADGYIMSEANMECRSRAKPFAVGNASIELRH